MKKTAGYQPKRIDLGFQPQASNTLTEGYQPQGSDEIPTQVPVLVSGVVVLKPTAIPPPASENQNGGNNQKQGG